MLIQAFRMLAAMAALTALGALDAAAAPPDFAGGGPEELDQCATIVESGSYVLKHDLVQPAADESCLVIAADHVTVDLAGFTIFGSGGSSGDGIRIAPGPRKDIEIANGAIQGFGDDGVRGVFVGNTGFRLLRLRVTGNGNDGIEISGSGHLIADSYASGNGNYGIAGTDETVVSGNVVHSNSYYGITLGGGSGGGTIVGNSVSDSPYGIEAGRDSIVRDNMVTEASEVGIDALGGCLISGNTVSRSETAIRANSGSNLVKGNVIRGPSGTDPETGIRIVGSGNSVEGNLVTGYSGIGDAAIRVGGPGGNYCQDNRLHGNGANDVVDTSGGLNPACAASVSY